MVVKWDRHDFHLNLISVKELSITIGVYDIDSALDISFGSSGVPKLELCISNSGMFCVKILR